MVDTRAISHPHINTGAEAIGDRKLGLASKKCHTLCENVGTKSIAGLITTNSTHGSTGRGEKMIVKLAQALNANGEVLFQQKQTTKHLKDTL